MTVNVCPATVAVPLRCGPLFEATLNVTVASLLPLPLELSVSHDACGEIVVSQAHPSLVVTSVLTWPPPDPIDWDVGVMVYVQPVAWLTV